MVNPEKFWMAQRNRTLCTESLGFQLCVQASTQVGKFHFTVRNRSDSAGGPSCVLAAGERPSAMQAMAAAERAALTLSCLQPEALPSPEQQPRPWGKRAAHRRVRLQDQQPLPGA